MDSEIIKELVSILHTEGYSCVIFNNGKTMQYHQRGVKDLLHLLKSDRAILSGARIADKVVGKGAAALMILGGVRYVYADVISTPALELLTTVSTPVEYKVCVPNIINRSGTGICPVETLCMDCETATDCLPMIEKFFNDMNKTK